MVAGAEDNLHAGLDEAGESPVEQGGAFGVGDAAVVDVPANEEGVNAFGPNVVEQFIDELSVLVGERAAVKGAAEVPVGGVQNLHGFSMAPLRKVRPAVRHSRRRRSREAGAPSSKRPQALKRGHSPASVSTKPPGYGPPASVSAEPPIRCGVRILTTRGIIAL